ncbi:MAG: MurT ligase domain-containing protein, partial [Eubacteriales bacterium]|nr:MurT ligase domain-containing protein [Eubacteriales bacterium]
PCTMILVKNPVGLEAGLREASKLEPLGAVVLMMNKRVNDGRDDSWLNNLDYQKLLPPAVLEGQAPVFICGESGEYLSQILNERGISHQLCPDYTSAFDQALAASPEGSKLCILPNYSAMLDFRSELVKRYNLPEFWER